MSDNQEITTSAARECIGILYKSFKEVPDEEKELAWERLKNKFDYPPEAGLALKQQALIKINSSWKKVQINVGTGGDIRKANTWTKEDEAARRSRAPVLFADLEEERARNWARARVKQNPDGTVMFPNQADANVYRQMQHFAVSDQSSQSPQVDVSPTGLPSSYASTGMDAQNHVVPSAVDHMNEDTAPCVLQVRVTAKFSSDAAEGLVFKPSETIRVHGAQLLNGHAKVQVDRVLDGWVTFPLENPPNVEIVTLGAAKGTYIQWPKCDIIIRMKTRPPIPPPKDMPPPTEPNVEASIVQALTDPHFGCGPAL
uniref:DUF8039 domain-containing protein n=1 Tax=Oryza brachyantha TaxID=4533 RepID=J3NDB1_ORYBR